MKLIFFIITVLICTPSIAQVEVNNHREKNSADQVALCETKVSKDAEIIITPGILDDAITILPKGTRVSVFTTAKGYWLIETSEIEGYINEKHLKVTNKMRWARYDANAQDNAKSDDARIQENRLWEGMSIVLVREAFGEPNAIHHIYYNWWNHSEKKELWTYDNKSLYFEDGNLVWWRSII